MFDNNDNFCGRCEHVCVSIYTHKYISCGLTQKTTTWWSTCESHKVPEKKYWVHSGSVPFDA